VVVADVAVLEFGGMGLERAGWWGPVFFVMKGIREYFYKADF
jgi:hypothetical protein